MSIRTYYNNMTTVGKVMCFQMAVNVGLIWYIIHVDKDLQALWNLTFKELFLRYMRGS